MDEALGYFIEDIVVGVWILTLFSAVLLNIWRERRCIDRSEKAYIIRYTNRSAVINLCLIAALAVDFRAIHGIYGSDLILYDYLFGYICVGLLFISATFVFFTLRAATQATASVIAFRVKPIPFYLTIYFILPLAAFFAVTITTTLSWIYDSRVFGAAFHAFFCVLIAIELVVFWFYSLKLQRGLKRLPHPTADDDFKVLTERLRVQQIVWTIPAACSIGGMVYFLPDKLRNVPHGERSKDEYDPRYALGMWAVLVFQTTFIYAAWVRRKRTAVFSVSPHQSKVSVRSSFAARVDRKHRNASNSDSIDWGFITFNGLRATSSTDSIRSEMVTTPSQQEGVSPRVTGKPSGDPRAVSVVQEEACAVCRPERDPANRESCENENDPESSIRQAKSSCKVSRNDDESTFVDTSAHGIDSVPMLATVASIYQQSPAVPSLSLRSNAGPGVMSSVSSLTSSLCDS